MGTTSIDNSGGTQNAIEQVDLGRGDLGAVVTTLASGDGMMMGRRQHPSDEGGEAQVRHTDAGPGERGEVRAAWGVAWAQRRAEGGEWAQYAGVTRGDGLRARIKAAG